MTYESLRAQMLATLEAMRQRVIDGTAPPSAALAEIYFQQLIDLEQTNAPLDERVRTIRQILSLATGLNLPSEYRGGITA